MYATLRKQTMFLPQDTAKRHERPRSANLMAVTLSRKAPHMGVATLCVGLGTRLRGSEYLSKLWDEGRASEKIWQKASRMGLPFYSLIAESFWSNASYLLMGLLEQSQHSHDKIFMPSTPEDRSSFISIFL